MISLNKLTTNGKALFLAYDQGLELGPDNLRDKAIDPEFVLQIAIKGGYNAIVLQKGLAEKYQKLQEKIPLILKLNGKTELSRGDPISRQICSVKEAVLLGAEAVGYTIYPGSQHESVMIAEFGKIVEQAHKKGIPAILWSYPKGKNITNETSPENVCYAARIGLELGADIVKIKYCGSKQCFEKAVKAAGAIKVMMAGGPEIKEQEFLKRVKNVIAAGAIGVVVGRNVWLNKNPLKITERIKRIVFTNNSS